MDWTGLVAVAGIAGTLLAPVVSERMRRNSARIEHLLTRRVEVYSDLLRVTAQFTDNAMNWSSIPLMEQEETSKEELDRIMSQMRVVATRRVFDQATEFSRTAEHFTRSLFQARSHERRLQVVEEVDDVMGIRQRIALGAVADKLREEYHQLLESVRKDMT